ncbi:hypothetical protein CA85_25870 [Allorhodopirellula solitaria]|uniref:Uncharacterized protein n=2 Tax=Allorhodopirellula solitaria TaxID=2527987 RepID=A0A5C5XY95_9BACT|nr:hypothetical protein CA85_25870 [Allorhodopirellula solitaria]
MVCGAVLATVLDSGPRVYAADPVSWSTPMGEVPAATADDALVVVLMTNDVAAQQNARKRRSQPVSCWCQRSFERSVSRVPAGYSLPSAPIDFQHWAVGLPPIVTGGERPSDVERAIAIVTDGKYRILALSVGVPHGQDLRQLIEDAEDTRVLLRQDSSDANESSVKETVGRIVDRIRGRLNRIWQRELDRQFDALGEPDGDPIDDLFEETTRYTSAVKLRLGSIAGQLHQVYLQDAQTRFGLTEASDLNRLAILEQHPATRLPWVTTLAPFVVGSDLRSLYTDLAEVTWGQCVMPVERPGEQPSEAADDPLSLAEWVSQRDEKRPFTLQLRPPLLEDRISPQRAQVTDVARRRGLGWQDLDAVVKVTPSREVSPGEIAAWLSQTDGKPIDLRRPSRARFLFFRSPSDPPYPIRDGSPPGRAISMIRQVQK